MTNINEATLLIQKIEEHPHFSKCLKGIDKSEFNSNKTELIEIKTCSERMKNVEKDIIKLHYDVNTAEKELGNTKSVDEKELETINKKLIILENINIKENERKLNECINNYNYNELKNINELRQLDKEIFNLKNEMDNIKERLENELDLKKKEELFKLSNDYKIKLLQYENKKKIEKQEKEKEIFIKQKQIEADKEIELNELQNKAELVKKIIAIYKSISLV